MISRRDFLKYCGISAVALGLTASDLLRLENILANPSAPTVLWLQGSGCTGCSISFLNRTSEIAPKTATDVLISSVNLAYHPNLMSVAGESAVEVLDNAYNAGGYVLAVEGGIPTAFSGSPCWAWTYNDNDVTFQDAVTTLASKAAAILAVGTCASWGGISAAAPNVTGVQGVAQVTGKSVINIAGCPPHPDWIVWVISQILLGNNISLDASSRPTALFNSRVHDKCPRHEREEAERFGIEGLCLEELGCRGPATKANCPTSLWNGKVNWCIGANGLCIGCTEPGFPWTGTLAGREDDDEDDD